MPGLSYTLGLDSSPGIAGLNAMRGALSGFTGMVGKLGPLMGLAGGLGVAGGAVAAFKKSIDEAAQMETITASIEVLTGSVTSAKAAISEMMALDARSPLGMDQIGGAAKTLLSFGVQIEKVTPMLATLSDVSGGNAQRFESLALAFSQTASAGRLMGQDLLQYINAGFNPLEEISRKTGKSMAVLRKEVEAGGVSFQQVADAFQDATAAGGRFAGFTEKMSGTWSGMVGILQSRFTALFREFGTPILPALKPILQDGIGLTEQLALTARRWGENVAYAIGLFRNAKDAGRLGELAGLSLRVGFADATNWLTEKLASIWESMAAGASGMFAGLGNVMTGLGNILSAAITKGIVAALESVKVLGASLISPEMASAQRYKADRFSESGRSLIGLGAEQLGSGALGGVAAALKGLVTPEEEARQALAKLKAELAPGEVFGPTMDELKEVKKIAAAGPAAAAAPARAIEGIKPFGDRLAKIGGFIGGSGGARGEKAQRDTALHTGKLVTLTEQLLAKNPAATGVFA